MSEPKSDPPGGGPTEPEAGTTPETAVSSNAKETGEVSAQAGAETPPAPEPGEAGESAKKASDKPRAKKRRRKKDAANTSFFAFAKQTYGLADPRSLGLFRIALGILLFVNVARRFPDIEAHYANTGWLTNHYMLFRPMSNYLFSIYLAFSTPGEVKTMMFIHLAVCVLLIVGFKTRLMQVLAALLTVSIGSRNIMLENGGWVVLTELTIWSMFLPLGRRFSLDALLASLSARRETTPEALNDRSSPPRDTTPVVSFAVAALIFQWVVIYYFNVVHKTGPEWKNGTAVYYFFQQDRMVTALGAWVRDFLPFGVFKVMTYSTLVIEALIALLLASPFRTPISRMVAWGLSATLHLSIDAVVQLGPFSWAMVTMFWVLIPREAWDLAGSRLAKRWPERELPFDAGSGFWLSFCRFVKRFDVLDHVRFVPVTPLRPPEPSPETQAVATAAGTAGPGEGDEEEAEDDDDEREGAGTAAAQGAESAAPGQDELGRMITETLVVVDPRSGRRYRGRTALLRLGDAVPFGRLLLLPARLPGVSGWVEGRLARAARNSKKYDAYFEVEAMPGSREVFPAPPSSARVLVGRSVGVLRESFVLLLIVCCGSQVLIENRAVPKWLKPEHRPEWMTAIVVYPRMFQGWSMFAPSPPTDDGRMVIDGITKDGRHFDPLTGEAPSFEVQPKGGFRMNQIWGDFHRRIGEERFEGYLDGVREMLKNFHKISGHPENELRSFQAWFVSERIVLPGQPRAAVQKRRLFSWGVPETPQRRRPAGHPNPHRPQP